MDSLAQFQSSTAGLAVTFDKIPANYGQCEQLVQEYCIKVLGYTPPLIAYAALWWTNATILANFTRITPGNEQNGDVGVFLAGSDINSPTYGHMDVVVTPGKGGIWTGWDSNWGGVVQTSSGPGKGYPAAHLVSHTYAQLNGGGFLRYNGGNMTPQQQIAQLTQELADLTTYFTRIKDMFNIADTDNGVAAGKIQQNIRTLEQEAAGSTPPTVVVNGITYGPQS